MCTKAAQSNPVAGNRNCAERLLSSIGITFSITNVVRSRSTSRAEVLDSLSKNFSFQVSKCVRTFSPKIICLQSVPSKSLNEYYAFSCKL